MARRKGRPRKSPGFRGVRFSNSLGAGALAAADVISGNLLVTGDAKFRLISLDFVATWIDIKAITDSGLMFGFAHSDYTAAEIEEALEITTSINQGDLIAREKADRLVRIVGTIQGNPDSVDDSEVFAGGMKRRIKLNWSFPIGKTLNMFVFNASGTVWTTGSSILLTGTAFVTFA